jgi:glycosyltransferase involved in cell wall biosynthesis
MIMRILVLTTWFSIVPGDDNLTNDLVAALAEQGHEIQVVLLDWSAAAGTPPQHLQFAPRVNVLALAPRSVKGLGSLVERGTKWIASSWFARRQMQHALKGQTFDLLIGFSPASVTAAQILYSSRICRNSYMIMWDFFPYHHRSIGLVTNAIIFSAAYRLENMLIRSFDVIGCMTPANEAYLKRHYKLRPSQKIDILPIWGQTTMPAPAPRDVVRATFELPADKKIVVFGGALSEGRGLDDILAAAELSHERYPELAFLIIGDGRLAAMVRERVKNGGPNIIYRKRIPRSNYLNLLTACDAGLVCTVRNVDVPTFPSKTIDYLRAGIPIVASVEASTDFGTFIETNGLGQSCIAGDAGALAATAARVVNDSELAATIRDTTRGCLERVFDVRLAAERILAHAVAAGTGLPR